MNRRCGARAEGKFICTLPSREEETPPLWWGKDELTLRSESRGCLHTLPSREEETPPLWWGKDELTLRSESRGCLHTLPSREEETPPLWWGKEEIDCHVACAPRNDVE